MPRPRPEPRPRAALRRLRGDDVAADDLERLFAAPAAVKAAPRPRKPRPPKV